MLDPVVICLSMHCYKTTFNVFKSYRFTFHFGLLLVVIVYVWGYIPSYMKQAIFFQKSLTKAEVSGYALFVAGILVTGICSPTSKGTSAFSLLTGGFFLCPLFGDLFWSLGRKPSGLPFLWGGLQTCSTAIFRFAAESGEDLFHPKEIYHARSNNFSVPVLPVSFYYT